MKKYVKQTALVLFTVIALTVCKSSPGTGSGRQFTDVMNKDWKLVKVHVNAVDIDFNRATLEGEGFGEIFTLRFDRGTVSGVGAPNRYSSPYKQADNQAVSISPMRSTLMAPIHEPEKLKEHDYYTYLHNVYKWSLTGGNLELHSKGEDGVEVVLTFALIG